MVHSLKVVLAECVCSEPVSRRRPSCGSALAWLVRLHHRDQLSLQLQAQLDSGSVISGGIHAANLVRTERARHRIDTLFDRFDVLLAPSASGEAPVGVDATGDPLFCRGWTLLGLPCVHLPFTRGINGLPVGLQLVGRWGDDHRLLSSAQWIYDRLTQ